MLAKKYIVFDIGKTKILTAIIRISRKNYDFLEIAEIKNPRNPKKIQEVLIAFCQYAHNKFRTKKVAISAAHLVNPDEKIVRQGKNCYGAEIFSFQFLEKNGFSVRIENDGRCFALGEYYFGKGHHAKNILTVNLGTEIGGGFIVDGKNYQGTHNSALEISHTGGDYLGPWKDWGLLCAGKGIENSYRRATGKKLSAKEIFLKAKQHDKAATEIIDKASHILGIGVAGLVNILDPEIIIFGGSLAKDKSFINDAVKIARKNSFNKCANYKFAISALGNKANLLGAALLYRKN
jgi:predicted NBD/HSP70 family sugar kinase